MAIDGIKGLKSVFGKTLTTDLQRNKNSAADRDADGRRQDNSRTRIQQLSPEQESQAVAKLNDLPAFTKAGLIASLIRQEHLATHVVVKNSSGEIVRRLSYQELIDLYLDRNSEMESGRLFRRAA
jgi:hypothetical protein